MRKNNGKKDSSKENRKREPDEKTGKRQKTEQYKKKKNKFQKELLFLLPSLIGVAVFYFIPFCDVFLRSFRPEFGGGFSGLENYKAVLENKAFGIAVKNTAKFVAIYIPALLLFSLMLAVVMDYLKEKQKLYKKIFLLPMAIPVGQKFFE